MGAVLGLLAPAIARAAPGSPFTPGSPQARSISDLFWFLLAIAALIFLLVEGLLIYILVRYRARADTPPGEPSQIAGSTRLEIIWTVIPTVLLVIVFVLMVPVLTTTAAPAPGSLTVTAVGHQWWWEYRYPDLGVVMANELHIPVGEPVRVQLQSTDVIHSFWIPRLNGKTDMVPGRTNVTQLQAQQAGTYLGQCAEFCGLQHAGMLIRLIAQPRAEFDAWVAQQRQARPTPPAGAGQQTLGRKVFTDNTCGNCHAIQGTAANGKAAPDLTHVGSRQTLAAGLLGNNLDTMTRWLRDPQAIKPGANMPKFSLTDDELAALAAYLEGLK